MSNTNPAKEQFLQRVRTAVRQGNQHGYPTSLPIRGCLAYQGGGNDLVQCFCEQLQAAGGTPILADTLEDASAAVVRIMNERKLRSALLGRGSTLDKLPLPSDADVQFTPIEQVSLSDDMMFDAQVGISEPDWLIAETGSIVATAKPTEPRSISLLPPVHIAVASRERIIPDLFDLFDAKRLNPTAMPSGLAIITGPSKTGDIELKLVTGVHGPGEVLVVLLQKGSFQR